MYFNFNKEHIFCFCLISFRKRSKSNNWTIGWSDNDIEIIDKTAIAVFRVSLLIRLTFKHNEIAYSMALHVFYS